jgi:hypothetical protein
MYEYARQPIRTVKHRYCGYLDAVWGLYLRRGAIRDARWAGGRGGVFRARERSVRCALSELA